MHAHIRKFFVSYENMLFVIFLQLRKAGNDNILTTNKLGSMKTGPKEYSSKNFLT